MRASEHACALNVSKPIFLTTIFTTRFLLTIEFTIYAAAAEASKGKFSRLDFFQVKIPSFENHMDLYINPGIFTQQDGIFIPSIL